MIKVNLEKRNLLITGAVILSVVVFFIFQSLNQNTKNKDTDYKTTDENNDKNSFENEENTINQDNKTKEQDGNEEESIYSYPISGDYEYNEYWKGVYKEYPWYEKLPIDEHGYKLYWIIQEKSFRIRLKISEKSPEEEKKNIIKQALDDIEKITGESYENYPYYVVYTEESN